MLLVKFLLGTVVHTTVVLLILGMVVNFNRTTLLVPVISQPRLKKWT
jgi:hypothetical protein